MFWIIGDKPKMTEPVKADLSRLGGNEAMAGELDPRKYDHSRAEVQAVLTPAVAQNEPIYVLAHAGYDDRPNAGYEPWIGGLWFDEITADMATKFTVAGLSGRTLWFLVCHTGRDINGFAAMLVTLGVRDTKIYMPTDFMYISKRGIPHVLPGRDDPDAANREVAKYDCDFMSLNGSLNTGEGWAGCAIDANGNVTAYGGKDVREAVAERFDPDGEGEFA